MLDHGYDFDFFSDRQLQKFTQSGKQIITGGNNYQTILLPANKFMTEKSFQKLFDLARNGAQILVYKSLPTDVPGFAKLDERRAAYKKLVDLLQFTDNAGIKKANIGKGSFMIGDDMEALLKAAALRKETLTEKGLLYVRRKNTDGYTYFIDNRGTKEVNEWITLSSKAVSAAMFNPMNGASGLANWRRARNGMVEVMVQLQPFESTIVQLFNTRKTGSNYPYIKTNGKGERLRGDWTLTFMNGGPAIPAAVNAAQLGSWTDIEGDAYKAFSGTAKYTTTFTKPKEKAAAWQLSLGKVNETAEVILNGKRIATLIGPNFNVVIPAANMKETNTLEVIVSNLMANRIIYMDKNDIPWKKFYNTNMPARRGQNARNGIFNASAWTPMPSGLTGPVTLTAVSYNIE
jgi:hypothetical protein